jgi:hypothetical protein
MSKWPMRGHFRYLSFKTFPMTPRTPQCEEFWALLLNSKHLGVPEDSKSPTLEVLGFTPTLGQSGVATVWNYSVESIDYWTIFSLNFLKNQNWKLYWNLGALLVLLGNPHQVWFNKVDFVILRPKMWTILLDFSWVCIVVGNYKKIAKRGLEGKFNWMHSNLGQWHRVH